MNVTPLLKGLWRWTKRNSTKLLAAGAISAEVLGFIFMHKEAPIVKERLDALPEDAKWYEKARAAGPVYLPAIGMLLLSCGCIVGGCAVGERKAAIMASLYSASEASLRRLEKKVIDEIGPEKAKELHDKAVEDLTQEGPRKPKDIICTGKGDFLCYEMMTGQWFRSSVPAIKKDEAEFNEYLQKNCFAEFDEWTRTLGINRSRFSDFFGFDLNNRLSLKLSAELRTSDGEPYCVVDYMTNGAPVMYNGKRPMEFSRYEDCFIE